MTLTILLIVAIAAGLYMAWNIGANDVANAFGTSVGSGALTIKKAIILAAIFEFGGAYFVGSNVAKTIRGEIINTNEFRKSVLQQQDESRIPTTVTTRPVVETAPAEQPVDPVGRKLALGMLAALIGASIWLNVATYFGQPVSTTHAIIGAVIGFAVVVAGPQAVVWSKMGKIAASWFVSPVVGGLLAFIVYKLIQKFVLAYRHPVIRAREAVPLCCALVICIISTSIFYDLMHLSLNKIWMALPYAALVGMVAALIIRVFIHRVTRNRRIRRSETYDVVERWFGRIQIVTACYMSFAHGANDVANSIGPLAGVIQFIQGREVAAAAPVPSWLLALGGVGIVVGLATYGYKVMESIGKKITEVTPTRGFSAEFGTATTVLVCSIMGLPISTTFVLVGAVMGVGLARGFAALDLQVIKKIFASWVITIPASAIFGAVVYWLLVYLWGGAI